MDGWTDVLMDVLMDGWADGWMDRQVHGQMHVWTDGRTGGQKDAEVFTSTKRCQCSLTLCFILTVENQDEGVRCEDLASLHQ